MENATKALIIAGAILVSILLVTMGITLLRGTGGLQGQQDDQMNEMTVESFNGQFKAAIGDNVTGDKVLDLIDKVDLKKRNDPDLDLTINYDGVNQNKIRSTSRYSVAVEKDDAGYINVITIGKPKRTSTGG